MREGRVEFPSEAMPHSIIVQERTRQEQVNSENQQPSDLSCTNEEPVRISSFTTPSFGGHPPPLPPETPMMRTTPRSSSMEYVQQGSIQRSVRSEGTEHEATLYIPGNLQFPHYLTVTTFRLLPNGSKREVENETR